MSTLFPMLDQAICSLIIEATGQAIARALVMCILLILCLKAEQPG